MRTMKVMFSLLLAVGVPLWAQQAPASKPSEKPAEPATKVERFIALRGQLIIKDFYSVGEVRGVFNTSLELDCLVLSTPATVQPETVYGVRFSRPAVEKYESEQYSFLDFDDAGAFVEVLDYMIKRAAEMSTQDIENREVIYETQGGMQIGFFQEGSRQTAFARTGGSIVGKNVFFPIGSLTEIRAGTVAAIEKLKSLGAK